MLYSFLPRLLMHIKKEPVKTHYEYVSYWCYSVENYRQLEKILGEKIRWTRNLCKSLMVFEAEAREQQSKKSGSRVFGKLYLFFNKFYLKEP